MLFKKEKWRNQSNFFFNQLTVKGIKKTVAFQKSTIPEAGQKRGGRTNLFGQRRCSINRIAKGGQPQMVGERKKVVLIYSYRSEW